MVTTTRVLSSACSASIGSRCEGMINSPSGNSAGRLERIGDQPGQIVGVTVLPDLIHDPPRIRCGVLQLVLLDPRPHFPDGVAQQRITAVRPKHRTS